MEPAVRVLVFASGGALQSKDWPRGRFDVSIVEDEAGLLPEVTRAACADQPFDAVVIGPSDTHSPRHQWLESLLRVDPHLNVVVCDDGATRGSDETCAHRIVPLADTDAIESFVQVVAREGRARRELAALQAELAALHRASRSVSTEFQRQNRKLKEQEERLNLQNQRFDAALNNMSQGLCMFDAAGALVVCNRRYVDMYSLPADLLNGGWSLPNILHQRRKMGTFSGDVDAYCVTLRAQIAEGTTTSLIIELSDGRTISIVNHPMGGGGWVATHEDITERTQAEAKIKHMARHDALTNLPNRIAFRDSMEQALARSRRGEQSAILCLDLDHFKGVNDTLGHPTGDALLRAVTERLKQCLRETDTVCRLGGDEFAVLQADIARPEDAGALAQRLIAAISQPYDLNGHHVVIGTSIGIALAPQDGDCVEQLLRNADMALYRAKADGRATYSFFEPGMDAQIQARRTLELELRSALANGEFELEYQPVVSVETEQIVGCEALVRWRHPERGLVQPAEFISIAEEMGLIVPLGEWVLRQACRRAATWPEHVKIAVNVSPAQFKSRTLYQIVASTLAETGLTASRLELEITESVLLHDNETTLATLHHLRALGVRISMDDFGTGYSSLSYLRSFPFDKIKIDRSFVRDLSKHGDCAAIVKAVAGLGQGLGIVTTAEGVETRAQMDTIRAEGCTEVQGYLFSPPKPAHIIDQIINDNIAAHLALRGPRRVA
jgi:diguanylate cyclase (GGDEF)-like protein